MSPRYRMMAEMSKEKGLISSKIWDVIVIGGGPAGMMAAGTAASRGLSVLLLEKNPGLGKKLLITGGGRCNVTNTFATATSAAPIKTGDTHLTNLPAASDLKTDNLTFLKKFKDSDKFLFSPFSKFSIEDTLQFFESRGMPTKVEAEGRVFPLSNTAQSVWDVLVNYIEQENVEIRTGAEVDGFVLSDEKSDATESESGLNFNKKIKAVKLKSGQMLEARSFVLATGGTSRPDTGSTGDGFKWLKKIGHNIVPSNPSLVPVAIKDGWVKRLSGVTLADITLSLSRITKSADGTLTREKIKSAADKFKGKGKILFTHFGITGPTVLNMSKDVGDALENTDYKDARGNDAQETVITLDLLPALDYGKLNTALQELFSKNANKMLKNSLGELIPHATSLVQTVLDKASVSGETKNNSVTREARIDLVQTLKNLDMHVAELLGEDKAIISSGGVALGEVDFKTMASTIAPNLHLVGDVLDIDRPSGGYGLQLCWTTGFVAGESVNA